MRGFPICSFFLLLLVSSFLFLFCTVGSSEIPTSLSFMSFNVKNEENSTTARRKLIPGVVAHSPHDFVVLLGVYKNDHEDQFNITSDLSKSFANAVFFGKDAANDETGIGVVTNWKTGDSEFICNKNGSILFLKLIEPFNKTKDPRSINLLLAHFPTQLEAQQQIMENSLQLLETHTNFNDEPTFFIADFGVRAPDSETAIPMLFTPKGKFQGDFVDGFLMCYYNNQRPNMSLGHSFPFTFKQQWRSQRVYLRGKAGAQEVTTLPLSSFENTPISSTIQAFVPEVSAALRETINNILTIKTTTPTTTTTTSTADDDDDDNAPAPEPTPKPVKQSSTTADDLIPAAKTTKTPTTQTPTRTATEIPKTGELLAGHSMTAVTVAFGCLILVAILGIWFWRRRRARQRSPSYASLELIVRDNQRLVD